MTSTGGMPNSFDMNQADLLDPELAELVTRRSRVLGAGYRLFYDEPVQVVRGEGVHLFDELGRDYLDAYNNVPCVGHCHPYVANAIATQARTLNTNTRYLDARILDYSERLLATHGNGLTNVMYTCTGSEATDLALRIARYATGAEGIVVTSNAYHGVTAAAAAVSPSLGSGSPLGEDVRTVSAPALGASAEEVGARLAADVRAAIDDLAQQGIRFAAFLADSIFSSDGLCPDPAGFLRPVGEVVRSAGGLYIADEVQSGFARTGEAMWGYQRHGLHPDLVTMGKPMGNGIPIAAVAMRPQLVEEFGREVRYFNTFGGNSVSIAAATAVLDVIETDALMENALSVGGFVRDGLADLSVGRSYLEGVRGAGLYLGVDLVDPDTQQPDGELARRIVNDLRRRRVLISATGPEGHTLKIRPPLPFSREDGDRLLGELEQVLLAVDAGRPAARGSR
jgi:4-aminobutyrate aminotransferase-like enzyme